MHFVCSYTFGYFSVYDDEYGRVHYDDNGGHASHDIQGSIDLQMSLQTTSSIMMGPGGVNHLGTHTRTCRSCVGKYYPSNFVRIGGHPYGCFQ